MISEEPETRDERIDLETPTHREYYSSHEGSSNSTKEEAQGGGEITSPVVNTQVVDKL